VDPILSRRYLEAMGVTLWRLRQPRVPVAEGGRSSPDGLTDRVRAEGVSEQRLELAAEQAPSVGHCGSDVSGLDWEPLQKAVAACRACVLFETRNKTVFGVGDRDAGLMIIGEAPGADEDRQGEPFVGRAGQLLDRMLASIGLERRQVYIANVLKCRPPGNRDPKPEEAIRCMPFLMRQIALVRPRVLLAVGRVSAQNLLNTDDPVGRLRGRWFELGPEHIPLRVTYHPSYLLRSPEQKGKAWQDLMEVARILRFPMEDLAD